MPISAAAMNASHGWARNVAYVALYDTVGAEGDPGTPVELDRTILNILGQPIYLRRPVSLSVETSGMLAMSNSVTFGVPAGSTVAWYGLLDAASNVLVMEPISTSTLANVPWPCLFDDLATGWISNPATIYSQIPGSHVVFWSGHAPGSTVFPTGAYTTLPSNMWQHGAYTIWPVRERKPHDPTRFSVNSAVGLSDAAGALDVDVFKPSNRGWGFFQRMDALTYPVDGTYTLSAVHVRTVG